jgi:glycosyltransferase involved in cell wall biosynthesis
MRLLFYTGSLRGGGAERVAALLCNKLSEKGYDIYLAVSTEHPFAYLINDNIHIKDLSIRQVCKGLNRLRLYKRIRDITKEIKPDIIISFQWSLNVKVILVTLGLHLPIIASEHIPFRKNEPFWESFCRFRLNRLASKVTILTQQDYDYLGKRLPNKIVIPNPLSYPIYEGDNKRKKNLLCVGAVDRWYIKGFDNIIKIWSRVSPLFPDWTLDIAGNGLEKNFNYLKQIAEDNNVLDKVNFLGFRRDIDKLMQESSIFCLSSRYEGFGMVLIEAMSQGCACISFDCKRGPREIITDRVSGVLIKDQDMEKMEQALVNLMRDEKLRIQLSIEGRREVKKFDADTIVSKWMLLFKEILKNNE